MHVSDTQEPRLPREEISILGRADPREQAFRVLVSVFAVGALLLVVAILYELTKGAWPASKFTHK